MSSRTRLNVIEETQACSRIDLASAKQILRTYTENVKTLTKGRLRELGLFLKVQSKHNQADDITYQFKTLARMDGIIPGHVPKVFMLFEVDGKQAYLMEKITGQTPAYYREKGMWPFQMNIGEFRQELIRVVELLHKQDFIHGDIHEANVILRPDNASPVLIDPRDPAKFKGDWTLGKLKDLERYDYVNRVHGCLEQIFEKDTPF